MRRCWGRNLNWRGCARELPEGRFFCDDHWWQPRIGAPLLVVAVLGSLASIISVVPHGRPTSLGTEDKPFVFPEIGAVPDDARDLLVVPMRFHNYGRAPALRLRTKWKIVVRYPDRLTIHGTEYGRLLRTAGIRGRSMLAPGQEVTGRGILNNFGRLNCRIDTLQVIVRLRYDSVSGRRFRAQKRYKYAPDRNAFDNLDADYAESDPG